MVYVYNGQGTQRVDVLIKSVRCLIAAELVSTISCEELQSTQWMHRAALLVIPGGRDTPYTSDLGKFALDNIRRFIEDGGSYLGICAGAYFSCSRISFEVGSAYEIIDDKRELALFKGTAKGSVFPGFKYESTNGARMVPVNVRVAEESKQVHTYFNGGCEFLPDDGCEFDTLATYASASSDQIAAVYFKRGKGRVLLSGFHPEMDPTFLTSRDYTHAQWSAMLRHRIEQKHLFEYYIRTLLPRD